MSLLLDKTVSYKQLENLAFECERKLLKEVELFDVYEGKGIDPKRKSLALGLTFRDQSRTLGDEDVNLAVGQVIDLLEKNYKAVLRK